MQTIQTEDDNAAEAIARLRFPISVWMGQEPSTDETGPNQGGDQRLPGVGMFVGEHDHEPPVRPQRSVTRSERAGHTVLIVLLGLLFIAAKSAGIVYELTIILVMIPFGAKGIGEDRLNLRG